MQMPDYDALAARTFDEPYDAELRDAILVCADALGQIDDPRGPLIAMEHAMIDAEPRRALELRRAIHAHVVDHGASLLGGVASLLSFKRAIEIEWRAGHIYGMSIDARYLAPKSGISPGELVEIVLRAPAVHGARRLRVRVRRPNHVVSVVQALLQRKHPLPLEELEIGGRVWPSQLGGRHRLAGLLLAKYPNLYYLALDDRIVHLPIVERDLADWHDLIDCVRGAEPPTTAPARRTLGRALCSTNSELRAAALQRITALGPQARVFARLMTVLLQPRVVPEQRALVTAMHALGPARDRMTALAKVSSRAKHYDVETRRAAGIAAAAFRAALTSAK